MWQAAAVHGWLIPDLAWRDAVLVFEAAREIGQRIESRTVRYFSKVVLFLFHQCERMLKAHGSDEFNDRLSCK